jgi:hypothetical protein
MMFDLPHPFGPTTPTSCPGTWKLVGSTKDLNPDNLMEDRRTFAYNEGEVVKNCIIPSVPCFSAKNWRRFPPSAPTMSQSILLSAGSSIAPRAPAKSTFIAQAIENAIA